jgi:hypothetical protein
VKIQNKERRYRMKKLLKRSIHMRKSVSDLNIIAYAAEETSNGVGNENFDALFDGSTTFADDYRAEQEEEQRIAQRHEEAQYELDKAILWGVAAGAVGGPETAAAGGLVNGLKSISEDCTGNGCHFSN